MAEITHIVTTGDGYISSKTQLIPMRVKPNNSSGIVEKLTPTSGVSLLREWVTGNNKWAYVATLDEDENPKNYGFILSKFIEPTFNYKDLILQKSPIELQKMSPLGVVLKPDWWTLDNPYYDAQVGNYWVCAKLPEACVQGGENLQKNKEDAKKIATDQLFEYLGIQATDSEKQQFLNGYLSCKVLDLYLPSRPNSKLRMWVIFPATYVQYILDNDVAEPKDDEDVTTLILNYSELEIQIPISSLDANEKKLSNCLKSKYISYLKEDYLIKGFDFQKANKSLSDAYSKIRFLLKENDIPVSDVVQLNKPAQSTDSLGFINIRFGPDYIPISAYYSGEITDGVVGLEKGFSDFKNSYPFNSPRVGLMFLKQREMCVPSLTVKDFIEIFVIDPKPTIEYRSKNQAVSTKVKKISQSGDIDFDISFDFEFILKKTLFDLDTYFGSSAYDKAFDFSFGSLFGGSLDFLDPNINLGNLNLGDYDADFAFRLLGAGFRDSFEIKTGDKFSDADWLNSLRWKLGLGGLDKLWNIILRHIEIDRLVDLIGKDYFSSFSLDLGSISAPSFGNIDFDAQGFDISDFSLEELRNFTIGQSGFDSGNFSFSGGSYPSIGNLSLEAPNSSFDFDFDIPSFTTEIPTFDMLEGIGNIIVWLLERILSHLILNAIIYLIEQLIAKIQGRSLKGCGDTLADSKISIDNTIVKDYGGSNTNDMIKDSIGIFDDIVYESSLAVIFSSCGVPVLSDEEVLTEDVLYVSKTSAVQYLDAVSNMTTPTELLSLYRGSSSRDLLKEILMLTKESYPNVHFYLNNTTKVETFFACIGDNISEKVIDQTQQDITQTYKNPEVCVDIAQELYEQMKMKCPSDIIIEKTFYYELKSKVDKMKNMVNALEISKGANTTTPNIFDSDGDSGLISTANLKAKNQDFFMERVSETLLSPSRAFLTTESMQYYLKLGERFDKLVNEVLSKENLVFSNTSGNLYMYGTQFGEYELPKMILTPDGKISITDLIVNYTELDTAVISEAYPTPESVIEIINQTEPSKTVQSSNGLTQQQRILYGTVWNYQKQYAPEDDIYVTDEGEDGLTFSVIESDAIKIPSLPSKLYGLVQELTGFNELEDKFYSLIFKTILENIAKRIASSWTADQTELQQYSNTLSSGVNQIINYDAIKQKISDSYNIGDYENPNDEQIGPKQYGMLIGVLEAHARVYVLEYFLRSTIYYSKFEYPIKNNNFYEISKKYIKTMLKTDSGPELAKLTTVYNQVFDYITGKSDIEITGYTGEDRGIDYYIDSNFYDVYNRFLNVIKSVPNPKIASELDGVFLYPLGSLPVHSYAGQGYINERFEGKELNSVGVNPTSEYSLFGEDSYKYFRRGIFFTQNYVKVTSFSENQSKYNENWESRDNSFRGVANLENIRIILLKALQDNIFSEDTPLSDVFSSIKIGSRMCYGIAYWPDDPMHSKDSTIKDFCETLFDQYPLEQIGDVKPIFTLARYITMSLDKSIICLDGQLPSFKRILGDQFPTYEQAKENGIDLGSNAEILPQDVYTSDGTFSVVIPMFNREQEIDKDLTIAQFLNISDLVSQDLGILKEQYDILRNELINSDEYESLRKICFPLENMLHFSSFSAMQYYTAENAEVITALNETKAALERAATIVFNSKRFDYTGE